MRTEENCPPGERFLMAVMSFSDAAVKMLQKEVIMMCRDKEKMPQYETFINWKLRENELAVFTSYAYADLKIPKRFDCVFSLNDPASFFLCQFTLSQSIFEGFYPIHRIEHGHKHICVLTFNDEVPAIFRKLHVETKRISSLTWDAKRVLGFCSSTDIEAIIALAGRKDL